MSALIEVKNLSKSYWRNKIEIPVLNDINITIYV